VANAGPMVLVSPAWLPGAHSTAGQIEKLTGLKISASGEPIPWTRDTRPDNDEGTGPDVLWRDEAANKQLGFELKTDKDDPATYFKKDVAQGHDHLEWMEQRYPDDEILGLIFVEPQGRTHGQANPSADMSHCLPASLGAIRDRLLALIEDLRQHSPMERLIEIGKESEEDRWTLPSLVKAFKPTALADLK